MARPVIAITGPQRGAYMPRLLVALAIWLSGGRPWQLRPHDRTPVRYSGVVITGGHDIDPVLYAAKSEVHPRYDRERDRFEKEVIDDALKRRLPLLGICRGAQLLNICRGGSLFQELRSRRLRTSNRWSILPLKTLLAKRNTRLYGLMGQNRRSRINSLHNQGIDRLGDNLIVSGRDLDRIVQAIEDPAHPFCLGVQWHPEFLLYLRNQRALFSHLVEASIEKRCYTP